MKLISYGKVGILRIDMIGWKSAQVAPTQLPLDRRKVSPSFDIPYLQLPNQISPRVT